MKFLNTQFSLLLLCACTASAQQSAAPSASDVPVQLETVMYARLKPQSLVSSGVNIATQRWGELAVANASLRARLGVPLSIEPAFTVPGLQSRWLSNNPNDPVRQLARIVLLRYPSIVDAHLTHARLSAVADFDLVFNAQRQYKFASIPAEPYVDPPAPSANDFWCNDDTSPTCLARNPFAAVGFVPAIGSPPFDLKQTESYGQWGIAKIGAPNAWEKLGADRFDGNPGAGLYGSTNVAVIDFGIARGCDPFYGACNSSTKYHADLDANVRDGLSVGNVLASAQGSANDDVQEDGLEFLEKLFATTFLNPTSPRIEGGTVRQLTPAVPPNSYVSSGHGSHVTGIIAARLNGSQGAGVCPSCSLAVYRSGGAGASFTRMLELAVKNGAQAINMSWNTQVTIPGSAETAREKAAPSPLDALLNVGGSRDIWMVAAADNDRVEINSTQPAANVNVIAAGGSDLIDNFWNETKLGGTRCPTDLVGYASQCGSNYPNSANASRFLIAPAARILSTMYTNWVTTRALTFPNGNPPPYGLAACTPELFPDAADTFAPVFNANYGVCTGTSMSTPFVTGAGAVLRSANPLLSVQNMLNVFQASGNTIANVPNVPAAKRINVDAALNQVFGSIATNNVENRVIPLLAARSSRRIVTNTATIDIEEAATDWLMTTKPQMLIAGGMGELYFYRKNVTSSQALPRPQAGGRGKPYYDSPITLPTLPGYTSYPGTSNVAPQVSAFIFATQRTPYNGAPDNLVPLYRLAMQGFCRGKKHVYSSGLIASGAFTVSNLTTVGQKCSPTTNNSADPAVLNARFNLVSIEGFLFATAQPGTVPLKLKYSSAEQSYAVMTPADESRAEFAGYGNPASGEVILGYAYSNDTQGGNGLDNDTWPSAWEMARGMNELTTDGDCDGVADDAEYSLAGFPVSDPMGQALNCADMRIKKSVVSNLATYTVTNPVGPVAASAVKVEVDYVISTLDPNLVQGPLTIPSGWSCTSATYALPFNNTGITKSCTTFGNFATSSSAVFTVSGGGNKVPASEVRVLTTSIDPVGVNNTVN